MDKFFGFIITAAVASVGIVIMIAIAVRAWYVITGRQKRNK